MIFLGVCSLFIQHLSFLISSWTFSSSQVKIFCSFIRATHSLVLRFAPILASSYSLFNISTCLCRTPANSQRLQVTLLSLEFVHVTLDLLTLAAEAPFRAEPNQIPEFCCCFLFSAVLQFSLAAHSAPSLELYPQYWGAEFASRVLFVVVVVGDLQRACCRADLCPVVSC